MGSPEERQAKALESIAHMLKSLKDVVDSLDEVAKVFETFNKNFVEHANRSFERMERNSACLCGETNCPSLEKIDLQKVEGKPGEYIYESNVPPHDCSPNYCCCTRSDVEFSKKLDDDAKTRIRAVRKDLDGA